LFLLKTVDINNHAMKNNPSENEKIARVQPNEFYNYQSMIAIPLK